MGLLDSILGGMVVGGGQQQPAAGNMGGLSGLLSRFQQAGLGGVAQSWVGASPNKPVNP